MKKFHTDSYRWAILNARICMAFMLCSGGASLAMLSFGVPPAASGITSLAHLPASPVIVTEFSDFQCPYCKRAASVVEQVRQTYGERVKVVFKQMPLRMHRYAFKAAQASVCARKQGKFWEYHDRLFASSDLSVDALNRIATEVGLKQNAFSQCMASDTSRVAVQKDIAEANRLGVSGTPTFFVNGKAKRGSASFAAFKQEIDGAMVAGAGNIARLSPASSANTTPKGHTTSGSLGQLPLRPQQVWNLLPATINFGYQLVQTLTDPGGATLSINDVTLAEDSCQNTSFVFTVTLSHLGRQPVTVNYVTQDGAAVANKDYVPVAGTLSFTHSICPNGPHGSCLLTIAVPLGNYVVSSGTNDPRSFTVNLSGAINATISKAQGLGTLLSAALSCTPAEKAACFVNFCGATTACKNVNRSVTNTPYCELAQDSDFANCNPAGLWVDSDGDGLSDAAEAQGYIDVNANGVNDPGIDIPLPGADPYTPDVYLHYDYTYATDHDHNPPPQAIQWIVDAFAAHGANLHIDPQHNAICENAGDAGCITVGTGAQVVTLASTPDPSCAGTSAVSPHQLRAAIPYLDLIKPFYHYMVFGHYASCPDSGHCPQCPNDPENPACVQPASPPAATNLGTAEITGDDAIVATQPLVDIGFVPNIASIPLELWAGLAMHEFGHNLGLLHGGVDCYNNKPNYVGVMNYRFYTQGIPVGAMPGDTVPQSCTTDADCNAGDHTVPAHCSSFTNTCFRIDYSDRVFNSLNEAGGLDETTGLQGGANNTDISFWHRITPTPFVPIPTNGFPIDWNKDGNFTDTGVTYDVNGDTGTNPLPVQNDWETTTINGVNQFVNLHFSYQCSPNFGD